MPKNIFEDLKYAIEEQLKSKHELQESIERNDPPDEIEVYERRLRLATAKKERRDRILAALRAMARGTDPEKDHGTAEELLLELIDDPAISIAFRAIERWYA